MLRLLFTLFYLSSEDIIVCPNAMTFVALRISVTWLIEIAQS